MNLKFGELSSGSTLSYAEVPDIDVTGWQPSGVAWVLVGAGAPQRTISYAQPAKPTLAEMLFEATAEAKIWTSSVAMRLDRATRDRFFRQLDRLHDIEEWSDDGEPLHLASYKTFVRSILFLKLDEKPALALMPNGNLLGIWTRGQSKLSIEFHANDVVRWVLSEPAHGRIDRIAGDTGLERLRVELCLRNSENWFS